MVAKIKHTNTLNAQCGFAIRGLEQQVQSTLRQQATADITYRAHSMCIMHLTLCWPSSCNSSCVFIQISNLRIVSMMLFFMENKNKV